MRPTPRTRNPTAKAATATATDLPKSKPTPRSHNPTANAATATPTPRPMIRSASGQAPPKHPRLIIKVKSDVATPATSQLASPPITPPATGDTVDTPSQPPSNTTGEATNAVTPPQWLFKMQRLHEPTLPGLSTPLTVLAKTYTQVS